MYKFLEFIKNKISTKNEKTFRKAVIIYGAILVSILFFTFFAGFNFFILQRENVALLNTIALFMSIMLYLYLNRTNNINITAILSTSALMLFLILFVYYAKSDHYSLIWTIFLPIYAIFVNGKKRGLYFSLIFYLILFVMTYMGINEWENGEWTLINWIRFFLSSSLMLFAVYLNESAYELYEKKLELARYNEAKLVQRLSELSLTDPLTQLYNRRYYDNIITKMIANAKREKMCIHFFILDIDFFKNYNDFYGHEKGDQTLIKIANLVKQNIQRESDFVFRLGGEEFAGILISKEKEDTQKWIIELNHKIEDLKIEHKQSLCSQYITVSIGISSECEIKNLTAKELYLAADKALYQAKLKGRNQTQIA